MTIIPIQTNPQAPHIQGHIRHLKNQKSRGTQTLFDHNLFFKFSLSLSLTTTVPLNVVVSRSIVADPGESKSKERANAFLNRGTAEATNANAEFVFRIVTPPSESGIAGSMILRLRRRR
ncbi:hypothetical protein RJT34_06608 [Clitoria ternatea]|uniref:Uncharacterized protein n=1 Tax=Clitoria ternatea TaxID=43366 RepID=A0AAN9K502_CLITE